MRIFWDIETRSARDLEQAGAHRYASDASTEVLCVAYAVDDGDPELWTPGQQIPAEFLAAAGDPAWLLVAHNDQFERAIETHLLAPRFGWPLIPIEQRRCTLAMARASALPGRLETVAAALNLPYQKDADGYRLMKRMARPRRAHKDEDAAGRYWVDTPALRQRLADYCRRDVEVERALFHRLPSLSGPEQHLWELDARTNDRGFHVDVELAKAARGIARQARAGIDVEVAALTAGEVTSVEQVARIAGLVRRHGHTLAGLTKKSVAAVLAHGPGDVVRRLLELRQEGARASTRKFDRLLASVSSDGRLRGTLRFHGAATGRWSGSSFQPQNLLKAAETTDLDAAIVAILTGDLERVRKLGAPLTLTGETSRSIICAAPGHTLIGADFSAIESRVLAWLAGETWKITNYQDFDATKDPTLEPYCATASRVFKRPVTPDDGAARNTGKTCDLAFGYGGGLGAWRKFDTSDTYSDADVEQFKAEWRRAHPATVRFWRALERAAHRAIRTGLPVELDRFSFVMEAGTLYMTLPSGRRLAYPEARSVAGKFEGTLEVRFKDNAKGAWVDRGAWYGVLVENAVSAVARDLLAGALLRLEAHSYQTVLHVHDEIMVEAAEGFGDVAQLVQLMTALSPWAEGLPIAAKGWTGQRYTKTTKGTSDDDAPIADVAAHHDDGDTVAPPHDDDADTAAVPHDAGTDINAALPVHDGTGTEDDGTKIVPLAALIGEPLVHGNICCPFHNDSTPSLHVYDDHFHCFGCGAHGDYIDWLMMVEGLTRKEALHLLETREGPSVRPARDDEDARRASALRLWEMARPIAGTLATRYLAERRHIDIAALPGNIEEVLRFHPRCPFGPGVRHPCLLALLRDVATDAPTGIQRIALTPDASKIERRMLGRSGVVKLWPAGTYLIIGEGIETTLAAASRVSYRGAALRPAWAAVSSGALGRFPVIPGVERLIILVDHDDNGTGQADAGRCADRWQRAGRTVVRLTPKSPGADFNDIIMAEQVS